MPVNSSQLHLQGLLDGLPMPGAVPALAAYITPPDPNVDAATPAAYVWPSEGTESRDPSRGGTIPRNTGPGTPAGFKPLEHSLDVYLVWFGADDDPAADTLFPAMVDAVMAALRTSGDPVVVTDPYTGQQSQVIDTGEHMTYRIVISALADQAYNRYDALITCSVLELLQA